MESQAQQQTAYDLRDRERRVHDGGAGVAEEVDVGLFQDGVVRPSFFTP